MGVRGLTTYVNSNQDAFLQCFYLHNSNIVVDGNSMCAQLYRHLNSFSAFGGDYDKYASYVRRFFKMFRKCNITPYVIFDGSYESRKLKTAYSRLKSKISGASRLDPVTQGCLQIFPLLLRDVFKEVLVEMGISYTICEFEADDEIAALARHLNCPVLSYDSDFFIYNVQYIPFNTLDHRSSVIEDKGQKINALECKLYKVQFLIENFGGLNEELLPLLATLLGNDFVEKRVFKKFFSQLKLPKSRKCKNEQQRSIHAMFKWLQNETLDSAIAKILGRLKKNEKEKVFMVIKKSVQGYNSKICRSLKYFNLQEDLYSELTQPNPKIVVEDICEDNNNSSEDESTGSVASDDEESSDGLNDEQTVSGVPSWFAEGVRGNTIPQIYLNLYMHHLYFCSPQAEDYNDEDSFLPSLPILRFAFDIITDYSHDCFVYVSREKDCSYKRIFVGKEFSIDRPIDLAFHELSEEQLKSQFHYFLSNKLPLLDLDDICLLPSDFQLNMISIIWWVAHCNVPLANIHSLFISYIMLEIIDEKTGTVRGEKYFKNKFSKKIDEIKRNSEKIILNKDELFLNKNKVQYEDCLLSLNMLIKHFEIDDSIRRRPKTYDVKKVHSFAQFQCCLQQINSLNCLCGKPFLSTKYSKCYNGTFVYNIALKLENQSDPIKFFEQYLNGSNTILKFYKSLCVIYERCAQKMSLTTAKWIGKKHRRKNKCKNEQDDPSYFLVKGFEANVAI